MTLHPLVLALVLINAVFDETYAKQQDNTHDNIISSQNTRAANVQEQVTSQMDQIIAFDTSQTVGRTFHEKIRTLNKPKKRRYRRRDRDKDYAYPKRRRGGRGSGRSSQSSNLGTYDPNAKSLNQMQQDIQNSIEAQERLIADQQRRLKALLAANNLVEDIDLNLDTSGRRPRRRRVPLPPPPPPPSPPPSPPPPPPKDPEIQSSVIKAGPFEVEGEHQVTYKHFRFNWGTAISAVGDGNIFVQGIEGVQVLLPNGDDWLEYGWLNVLQIDDSAAFVHNGGSKEQLDWHLSGKYRLAISPTEWNNAGDTLVTFSNPAKQTVKLTIQFTLHWSKGWPSVQQVNALNVPHSFTPKKDDAQNGVATYKSYIQTNQPQSTSVTHVFFRAQQGVEKHTISVSTSQDLVGEKLCHSTVEYATEFAWKCTSYPPQCPLDSCDSDAAPWSTPIISAPCSVVGGQPPQLEQNSGLHVTTSYSVGCLPDNKVVKDDATLFVWNGKIGPQPSLVATGGKKHNQERGRKAFTSPKLTVSRRSNIAKLAGGN